MTGPKNLTGQADHGNPVSTHGIHVHHQQMAAVSSTTTESEHVVDLLGSGPALRESPGEGLGLRPGGLWLRNGGVPPGLFRVESRRATRTALDRV